MTDEPQTIRKGKQLWLSGVLMADCASEGVAELIRIALVRARMSRSEADDFERTFP